MYRILIIIISLLQFYNLNAQIPTSGLVSYYPFNGNANDESGSGNNGVVNGAMLTTDRFGNANQSYFFDGTATISATDYNLPLGNSSRTLSAWVYCAQRQSLINNGNPAHLFKYGIELATTNYCNTALWGDVLRFSNNSAPPDGDYSYYHPINEWFHVLIRLSPNNRFDYFINGQLVYNAGFEIWNTISIGSILYGEFLNNGKLDDIRIYNRALCDAEVNQLYLAEAPPLPSINLSDGLQLYYPFNGNANDLSGNNLNGIVHGAVPSADRFGTLNTAYHFDGLDDYIETPYVENPATGFSVSVWVKANLQFLGSGNYPPSIIQNRGPLNGGGYAFSLSYDVGTLGAWSFGLDGDLIRIDKYRTFTNCNTWVHLVGTWEPQGAAQFNTGQMKLYVNGSLLNTLPYDFGGNANQPINPIGQMKIAWHEVGNSFFEGDLDEIRIYNRAINRAEVNALHGGFYGTCSVNWTGPQPLLDEESAEAISYLRSKNIIQINQQPSAITSSIRKDELAKILFKGLFEPDVNATTPVDDAPNPFLDLQPTASAYSREAKALSYLEYNDGISVFKREFTHFKPQFPILRKYVIKAMLETFNIKPYTFANAPTPSCWYNDVQTGDEMYYYILKAREMGFIREQTSFNPNNPITRKEAFLILYRILKYFETTPKPVPTIADYFIPSNITPCNFGRSLGVSDANFNAYTKTSFAIAGLMPLTFSHSYNSAYTELPDSSYNIIESLGKGWTHNYNCFLQRVTDDVDSTLRYVITWGDGTMNSFIDSSSIFVPECSGIYATLITDAGQNNFTYKTKSQVSYIFSKYVLSNRTIWVLTSVKDRNNNTLSLIWTPFPVVAVPSQIRLFKVQDASGRYLQFGYESAEPSKIKTVTAVTGSISRSIGFTYENNFSDLKAYINLKGDSTVYYYEDSTDLTKNHLLKKIKLPKGNIVDNTYEKRKLKSTQLSGQYQTNVNTQFNYTAANNTNFTESDISTTRNGITLGSNIKQDQQGNVKNAISPTGNLSLSYNDSSNSTKPTFFSNSVNNLSAHTNYDAMGNVTSVTKIGGAINLKDSFTYNGYNDILTYINAKGNQTEFTYNANGNLTKIKDALGYETNMLLNNEGTVSKVTNPEGIYTDFVYDAFGNTIQSKLMNAITANAAYDGASRLTQKTDPNGTVTKIEYDVNDLIKRVILDPLGLNNTVTYNYDKNDNLDTVTNPKGSKTSLKYNNYDQMTEYRFGGFTKTYAYNEDGTLNTFTNQNGNIFNYTYNANGTVQSDGYASYTYDTEFNLHYLFNNFTGKKITFGYDVLKRTNSIAYDDFTGNTVQYEYDNNSNVTAMVYPGGFKVGYEYDALDRLVRVYNFTTNSNFAAYTYYNDGRLKDQINGNGTKTVYRYDNFGRLDSIGNHTSGNINIASYKFTMDNIGNHLSETNYEPALPPMGVLQTEAITYTHDTLNRMKSRSSTNFTYDNNGNNSNATGQWNADYTFDVKDNLLTSTAPVLNCEYDGLENRRRKNDTLYVLDILGGSNVLMETNVNGNPYAYYIHGLGLICRLDASQANPSYYHYDYRGSTAAITNSSQTVTHSYRYGAFGEMMLTTETGFKNPYRYVGKYGVQYEGDSLYFMRARYYNAVKGRFLGEDLVWGVNLYLYGENNGITKIDITGNSSIESETILHISKEILLDKVPKVIEKVAPYVKPEKINEIKESLPDLSLAYPAVKEVFIKAVPPLLPKIGVGAALTVVSGLTAGVYVIYHSAKGDLLDEKRTERQLKSVFGDENIEQFKRWLRSE
jgi:RHS repeat-associated protein